MKVLGIICLLLFLGGEYYCSKYKLKYSRYVINMPGIQEKIRIVHLTDLHNRRFGKNNEKLVRMIRAQSPDLICCTGDMLNAGGDSEVLLSLVDKLASEFPVYLSFGNHELAYEKKNGKTLKDRLHKVGGEVLDFEYKDIFVNGNKVRIGGYYGYGFPGNCEIRPEEEGERNFLEGFQKTDACRLLLTHVPYGWYRMHSLDYWDVDIVLAGHTHGGQIRLPFIGGLYAPDHGILPGREKGLYYSENKKKVMVLSSGLGSSEIVPRINNVPEIVVLDIQPGKTAGNENTGENI